MDFALLNDCMLSLLEADCFKTNEYLVEELRMEYPDLFQQVMADFQKEYGLGGCGALMSPVTAVNMALKSLFEQDRAEKNVQNGQTVWRLKNRGEKETD